MKNENVEMKMWSSHPQKIDNWDTNIDYVMFIDENGNSGKINDIFKKRLYNEKISVDEKYFTITGVIFEKSNYSKMRNDIRKLKRNIGNVVITMIRSTRIQDMFACILGRSEIIQVLLMIR